MTHRTASALSARLSTLPAVRLAVVVPPGKSTEHRVFVRWADGESNLYDTAGEASEAIQLMA